jgi:hypothetical protein
MFLANLGRKAPRDRERVSAYAVIASAAKQSMQQQKERMNCFASLAMTRRDLASHARGMTSQWISPSLRGAKRRSNPSGSKKRQWIASRSLSSRAFARSIGSQWRQLGSASRREIANVYLHCCSYRFVSGMRADADAAAAP